jgi:hypothetical protein
VETVETVYEAFNLTKAEAAVADALAASSSILILTKKSQPFKTQSCDNTILSILNNDTAVSACYIIEQEDGKSRCCERR